MKDIPPHFETEPLWVSAEVHPLQTHHVWNGRPLYNARFDQVLKFHPPGLAAVRDESGSYHISLDGRPFYAARFLGTFGFYDGRAAVFDPTGWFHIAVSGEAVYPERYAWCGNFQNGRVPVRDGAGKYFHLDRDGRRIYPEDYLYAGDFRDGIACVRRLDGLCSHIDLNGKPVHAFAYLDLDVFHKGFARARDARGWMHVTADGRPAYATRFAEVEPFYNGQAYARDWSGKRVVIGESGQVIHTVWAEANQPISKRGQFIVVVGNCGSGKTTLGRSLASDLGIALLSIDDFRRDVSDGSPKGEVKAWQLFLEAISVSAGAVVEFSGSGHMAHLVKMELAERANYTVLWLQAPPEICLGRVAGRAATVPYPRFGVSIERLIPELQERLNREMERGDIWPRDSVTQIDATGTPAEILARAHAALAKERQ